MSIGIDCSGLTLEGIVRHWRRRCFDVRNRHAICGIALQSLLLGSNLTYDDDELLAAVQICDGEEITELRFRREEFRNARCLQEAHMGFQKRQIHLRRSWSGSSGGNESLNLTGSCLSRLLADRKGEAGFRHTKHDQQL